MFRIKLVAYLALLTCSSASMLCAQRDKPLAFSGDFTTLAHPVELPPQVMALLVSDKEDFRDGPPPNLRCNTNESTGVMSENPAPQLLCGIIPLSSKAGTDYLVLGDGTLAGAHVLPFWIFHQDTTGASLLFKTRSDFLNITTQRHSGYRDLESTWIFEAGATIYTERYRFNGKGYTKFSSHQTHN